MPGLAGVEINRFFKDDPDYVSKSAMKLLFKLKKKQKNTITMINVLVILVGTPDEV